MFDIVVVVGVGVGVHLATSPVDFTQMAKNRKESPYSKHSP